MKLIDETLIKMMMIIVIIIFLQLIYLQAEVMQLKDIQIGQKGKALTAVDGNKILEFDVEIISILNNVFPKKSVLLAKLNGEEIQRTGVMQGMSGSPIYINGKLVGAIAYSFPFSKEPIAGITPIEDMIKSADNESREQMSSSTFSLKKLMEYISGLDRYKDSNDLMIGFYNFFPMMMFKGDGESFQPIPFLLCKSKQQFHPAAESWWQQNGFVSIMSSAGAKDNELVDLKEGDPIAVVFLSGDLEMGGIGTVTHIDKNRVYAFGHPMFNLGNISLPMATAKIQTVVPNIYSSFKVGNIGKTIGTFKQDLSSAVFGFLNEEPPTIPMKLKITAKKNSKDYNFVLAEHNLLTPIIANMAINEAFASSELNYYEGTYEVNGTIEIEGYQNIIIDNIFAGFLSIDQSTTYVASILGYMLNNEFAKVKVKSIELNANIDQNQRIADIKQIKYDKSDVKKGDKINLEIYIKPYLKETKVYNYQIEISNKLKKGIYYVYVAGAMDLNKIDYNYYNMISIDNLKQLIRLINTIKKNNKIYIRVIRPTTSIIVKNKLLNNLPPSHFDIIFSSQVVGEVSPVSMEPVLEDSIVSDYMIKGIKNFIITVKD